MTDPVEAVLFDVDDTVCTYTQSIADVLAHSFDRESVDPFFTAAEYRARFSEFAKDGRHHREIRARCFESLAHEAGRDGAVGRALADAYDEERDQTQVRFVDGARDALDHATREYRVGVVTNGPPDMQGTKLDALGIADRFETVVHGGYDAPAKPAPEPFHRATDALGVEPGRTVHVGDSLASDVAGAHAAGVRSAWLAPDAGAEDPDPRPDYVLESMAEVTRPPWR